jgi:hypothetical protein
MTRERRLECARTEKQRIVLGSEEVNRKSVGNLRLSSENLVHQGAPDDSANIGVEEGFAEGRGSRMGMLTMVINRSGEGLSSLEGARSMGEEKPISMSVRAARESENRKAS